MNFVKKENELTIQSSRLKLIVSSISTISQSSMSNNTLHPTGFFSNNAAIAAISNSMTNLANLGQTSKNYNSNSSNSSNNNNSISSDNSYSHANGGVNNNNSSSSSNSSAVSSAKFVFLFTSDFERNAWLEEINGAIYACKTYLRLIWPLNCIESLDLN